MSSLHVRPRFHQILATPTEDAREAIVSALEASDARCDVKSFPGFIKIRITEEDRHLWSPRQNLSLDEADDGQEVEWNICSWKANPVASVRPEWSSFGRIPHNPGSQIPATAGSIKSSYCLPTFLFHRR
jgi:hypothetical protein